MVAGSAEWVLAMSKVMNFRVAEKLWLLAALVTLRRTKLQVCKKLKATQEALGALVSGHIMHIYN